MRRRQAVGVAVAALVLGAAAGAQQPEADGDAAMKVRPEMTRAQARAATDARFDALDRDHDGFVTHDELRAALADPAADRVTRARAFHRMLPPKVASGTGAGLRARVAEAMFARADADGDGKVSRAEAERNVDAQFDRADTDHDGRLSAAERDAARDPPMRGAPAR